MPKSRHRKNHKKKAVQRKTKIGHAKNRYNNKLKELYGAEMAKMIEKAKAKEGNNSIDDLPTEGGFIGGV